jgi:thiopurine S-methyltransferase
MHEAFWRDRWARGQIGFHESAPNAFLEAYVDRLIAALPGSGRRVLVPLAGKSADLELLAKRGFSVTGVELVEDAAAAFFRERGDTPVRERLYGYDALRVGAVRIAVGDFFRLEVPPEERFDAAYDRAALIAVRPEDRPRYVATCRAALAPRTPTLLVTLSHDGDQTVGPPFSVRAAEVEALYGKSGVELLNQKDLTDAEPRFRERGATEVLEQAFLVVPRSG